VSNCEIAAASAVAGLAVDGAVGGVGAGRPAAASQAPAARRNSAPANTLRPRTVNSTVIERRQKVGKGILLWLLGIPLPIIIILLLIWH
jgi:hypothetical protein